MKIEYEQCGLHQWNASFNGQMIAQINVMKIATEEETKSLCHARDLTKPIPEPTEEEPTPSPNYVTGSPFNSVNQAKAAIEWYFRDLFDLRTEYAA
jgi:hypothetical protein